MNKVKALEESRNDMKNDKGFQKNNWGKRSFGTFAGSSYESRSGSGSSKKPMYGKQPQQAQEHPQVKRIIITNLRSVHSVWDHILSRIANGRLVRVLHVVRLGTG